MYYAYVMCPKCKDKFIAVENLETLDVHDERRCPTCNNQYVLALIGEQKIDNTIYTVTFNCRDFYNTKENLRKRLNSKFFNIDEIMPDSENEVVDNIVYRGDTLHTFLYINTLTDAAFSYDIIPEFPFERCIYPDIALCPTCGSPTVEKTVPKIPDGIGFYCEKCNEWVMYGPI